MKILWFINIPLPEASTLMSEASLPFGGWMIEISKLLSKEKNIELSIAFPHRDNIILKGESIKYYGFKYFSSKLFNKKSNINIKKIIKKVNPDLVHIYGTELPHSLNVLEICEEERIKNLITIQGLISNIEKHFYSNLPLKVIFGMTIRNILKKDSIYFMKKKLKIRGAREIKSINKTKHVLGRTTWDKASIKQINPEINYHFYNETLRGEFYKYKWKYEQCDKNSIFISQGNSPIKGIHFFLKALSIVIKYFPNTRAFVGGKNILQNKNLKDKMSKTYYSKYISKLIIKNQLKNHIIFTGLLNEKEMVERYLKSNVYVCPSVIENSPNSLGEAMILGVPSVASYVGGIPDMLKDKEEGFLYQYDAPYMLAHYIMKIFKNKELALKFSISSRNKAFSMYNRENNYMKLLDLYKSLMID